MAPKKKTATQNDAPAAKATLSPAEIAKQAEQTAEIQRKIMSLAVGYGDADLVQVLKLLGFSDFDRDGHLPADGEALKLCANANHCDAPSSAPADAKGSV